jgi:hypothetical protein
MYFYSGPIDWDDPKPKTPPSPERAARRGVANLWYDLIEDDPVLKPAFAAAEREAREEFTRKHKPGKGDSLVIDKTKKRILKEKFGIDWRTVSELNPDLVID